MNSPDDKLSRISDDLLNALEAFGVRCDGFVAKLQNLSRNVENIQAPIPKIELETAIKLVDEARLSNSIPRRATIRKIIMHAREEKVPLDIIEWLVRHSDTAARELGSAFFSSWPQFFENPRGLELIKTIKRHPNRATEFLTVQHELLDYFSKDLIRQLKDEFPAPLSSHPAEWLREISAVTGFPARFQEIVRRTIVEILNSKSVSEAPSFSEGWLSKLITDQYAAPRLLPLRPSDSGSGFSPALDPTPGQTDFLAYALNKSMSHSSEAAARDADGFHEFLFSAFKDPRLNTSEPVWRRLRERHENIYDDFVQALSVGDLEFFFEQLDKNEKDPPRASFWKKYVGSIRNTKTFLKPSTANRIRRTAERTRDPKISRAASQAVTFQADSQSTSPTFCMYFDHYVVVEFLLKGNAMYVYDRRVFEQGILTRFQSQPRSHEIFKQQMVAKISCIHRSGGWEADFTRELSSLGITRSRRR